MATRLPLGPLRDRCGRDDRRQRAGPLGRALPRVTDAAARFADERIVGRLLATLLTVTVLGACAGAPAASGPASIDASTPVSPTFGAGTPEATPSVPDSLTDVLPDELLGTALEQMTIAPEESFGTLYDPEIGWRMADAFGIGVDELDVAAAVPVDRDDLPGVAILAIAIPDDLQLAGIGSYLYEVGTRPGAQLTMDVRERDRRRLELFVNADWVFMSRPEAVIVVSFDPQRWSVDDTLDVEHLIAELNRVLAPERGGSIEPDQAGPPSPAPAPAPELESLLPPAATVQGSYTFDEDSPRTESWTSLEEHLGAPASRAEVAFAGIEDDSLIVNAARIDGISGSRLVSLELGSKYGSPSNFGGSPTLTAMEVEGRRFVVGDGWALFASVDVAYTFQNVDCLFGCPADQSSFLDSVTRAVASIPDPATP